MPDCGRGGAGSSDGGYGERRASGEIREGGEAGPSGEMGPAGAGDDGCGRCGGAQITRSRPALAEPEDRRGHEGREATADPEVPEAAAVGGVPERGEGAATGGLPERGKEVAVGGVPEMGEAAAGAGDGLTTSGPLGHGSSGASRSRVAGRLGTGQA